MPPSPPVPPAWTIIVPVKHTSVAKTRLRAVPPDVRKALALAFASDVVEAALTSSWVRRVVVVTNDEDAAELRAAGAVVVPDEPDAGLNPALVHAAQAARADNPTAAVAAMSGDLPALTGEVLDLAFASADGVPYWFVPDSAGTGTTMLAAADGQRLSPAFGPRSRAAHGRRGAREIEVPGLTRLRRDVDTEDDLWDAVRLGVGRHTRAALVNAGLAPLP